MLSVSELSAVRKVLRQSDTSVPLTNFWQRLHTEEGIGSPIGKRIHFNVTDLSRLREMAIKTSGIDPIYKVIDLQLLLRPLMKSCQLSGFLPTWCNLPASRIIQSPRLTGTAARR